MTLASVLVAIATFLVAAQRAWNAPVTNPETVLLWPDGAPGALGNDDDDRPALTIYLPASAHATGAAVVVCPGGSYTSLAMDHEGHQVARLLTSRGIAAFILKYRLGPKYHHPAMLHDVLQAIRFVRLHASKYEVHPNPHRRARIFGRRAPGIHGSDAVRSRKAERGQPDRPCQQPT
jgi:acetyl esterase/lipase